MTFGDAYMEPKGKKRERTVIQGREMGEGQAEVKTTGNPPQSEYTDRNARAADLASSQQK